LAFKKGGEIKGCKKMKKMWMMVFVFSVCLLPVKTSAEGEINWVEGPKTVTMGDELVNLNVPSEMLYLNAEDTVKFNEAIGNAETGKEIGMVISKDENKDWFIVFEYEEVGHVEDDDSQDLNGDELLEIFTEGTEEQNKTREEKGYPLLEVNGWNQPPAYDENTHNLVWALELESEGEKIINYNTRVLSRNGYVSAILVSDADQLAEAVPQLNNIISNHFGFVEGNRYEDFNEKTDKLAGFGLTALIAGGAGAAAAKAGLFAKVVILFKKFFFLFIIAFGALYGVIKKRLKRNKQIEERDAA
jgi:uncharacterized membrane-anchored protein